MGFHILAKTRWPYVGLVLLICSTPKNAFCAERLSIFFPADASTTEAADNSNAPFWREEDTTGRTQIVYSAELFDALSGPRVLQEIRFRPDAIHGGNAFAVVIPNISVRLSTTQRLPDGLSSNFQHNIGPDEVNAFSGDLPMSTANQGPVAGPRFFDVVFTLATPFRYDPSQGNLLLDIEYPSGSGPLFQMDGVDAFGDEVSLVLQDSYSHSNPLLEPFTGTNGPAAQFVFVPEPSALSLTLAALLGTFGHRRRVIPVANVRSVGVMKNCML